MLPRVHSCPMDTIHGSAATPSRSIGAWVRAWLRREGPPANRPMQEWDDTMPTVWSGLPGEDGPNARGGEASSASASEE